MEIWVPYEKVRNHPPDFRVLIHYRDPKRPLECSRTTTGSRLLTSCLSSCYYGSGGEAFIAA